MHLAAAIGIGGPDAELGIGRVVFVDPAVAIAVECGEVGKTVATSGPEKFAAVVDPPVVVAIQGQESAAGGETVDALGGPVGVETMAAALSEPRDAIEDIIEPYLIQCGYLQRTPRGRLLTSHAFKHLGLAEPSRDPAQFGMFERDDD